MDEEIFSCVQSIFGDNVKIVDCEKNASVLEEEIVHINGIPVNLNSLDGDDAHAIKIALLEGSTPSVDILNKLLAEAGILQKPMQLETTTSIKSSLTTTQEVNISRNGQLLEERTTQIKEDSILQSNEKVIWQPPAPSGKTLKSAQKHQQLTNNCSNSSSTLTSTSTSNTTTSTASGTASKSDTGSQSVIDVDVDVDQYVVDPTCSFTSGQGLWYSNSMATAGCADDSISHETANLSLDSGFPVADYKQATSTTEPMIVYEDGALVSGTIEALVALLTPRHNYYPDTSFSYTFLLSARFFISPSDLFEQMAQTWQSRFNLLDTSATACQTKSVHNLLRLLNLWLNNFPSDFCSAQLNSHASQLLNTLPDVDMKEKFRQSMTAAMNPIVTTYVAADVDASNDLNGQTTFNLKDLCGDPVILAQQLLLLELQYLSRLSAEELLLENAENVKNYKQYTHKLTIIVAQHILQHTKKKQRVPIVCYWLKTAQECFRNSNFNSMYAIVSALKLPAIVRLSKMWLKVDSSEITQLEQQLDSKENYSNYRESLQASTLHSQNGATDHVVIPIFHILQADLQCFVNDFKHRLPNPHIDFDKCLTMSEFVQEKFEKTRGYKSKFMEKSEIIHLLKNVNFEVKCVENKLMLWSFACESPHSADEKKLLKAEKLRNKNTQ